MTNKTYRYGLFAASMVLVSTFAFAQDDAPADSLGDLARQSRAQHGSQDNNPNKAQELVDEMQQEQEAADNAPLGFKNYDAGEYRIFVPNPFSLEGREPGGGDILLGSRLGVTNTEVVAGKPIPIPANLNDASLANWVRQLAQRYSQGTYCSPTTLGSRKAFRCGVSKSSLLGHDVWGTMEIVVASNNVIPIMCVSPDDLNNCVTYNTYGYQTCSKRYPSWEEVKREQTAVQTRYQDERTTAQMCDQIIYPSIQFKEDIVVHPASIAEGKPQKPAKAVSQDATVTASGAQGPSLAELARKTRQAPHGQARATLDNAEGKDLAPAGFQSFVVQYCQNPQQCSEATVVIPEKAEVVSRINGQHIFKTMLNDDPVMLYAGLADVNNPYRGMTDRDYIRIRDVANSNGWSREKADGISTQELTIDGHPALMTRFRYQRDSQNWWIGERALIQVKRYAYEPGYQFMVGCTAPEQRFADAEALCTTLVNSLRLQ
jgi:hypothetical protein